MGPTSGQGDASERTAPFQSPANNTPTLSGRPVSAGGAQGAGDVNTVAHSVLLQSPAAGQPGGGAAAAAAGTPWQLSAGEVRAKPAAADAASARHTYPEQYRLDQSSTIETRSIIPTRDSHERTIAQELGLAEKTTGAQVDIRLAPFAQAVIDRLYKHKGFNNSHPRDGQFLEEMIDDFRWSVSGPGTTFYEAIQEVKKGLLAGKSLEDIEKGELSTYLQRNPNNRAAYDLVSDALRESFEVTGQTSPPTVGASLTDIARKIAYNTAYAEYISSLKNAFYGNEEASEFINKYATHLTDESSIKQSFNRLATWGLKGLSKDLINNVLEAGRKLNSCLHPEQLQPAQAQSAAQVTDQARKELTAAYLDYISLLKNVFQGNEEAFRFINEHEHVTTPMNKSLIEQDFNTLARWEHEKFPPESLPQEGPLKNLIPHMREAGEKLYLCLIQYARAQPPAPDVQPPPPPPAA